MCPKMLFHSVFQETIGKEIRMYLLTQQLLEIRLKSMVFGGDSFGFPLFWASGLTYFAACSLLILIYLSIMSSVRMGT